MTARMCGNSGADLAVANAGRLDLGAFGGDGRRGGGGAGGEGEEVAGGLVLGETIEGGGGWEGESIGARGGGRRLVWLGLRFSFLFFLCFGERASGWFENFRQKTRIACAGCFVGCQNFRPRALISTD